MRKLVKFLIVWAIFGSLFYVFGVPFALEKISAKTQAQSYEQCINHMKSEGLMGSANSPITADQAIAHCRCVSAGLTLTKADLLDVAQRKPPALLTIQAQHQSNECNGKLHRAMGGQAEEPEKSTDPDLIPL